MEDFLQVKKTVLEAGLKREYKFLQVSDMHISCVDELSSELDKSEHEHFLSQWTQLKYEFAKSAGEFCDERYDIEPNLVFEKVTEYALKIKADALVFSGDMIDRVTESNIRYMTKFLQNFPIPVVYCPGNHAWINERGERLNQYDRIMPFIKNPEYDSFDFGEFEIVSIDNGTKNITDRQIEFLRKKLSGEKKVILLLHAPICLGDSGEELKNMLSPYFLVGVEGDCQNAIEFNKMVKENDDKIIAILAGHIHAFYEGNVTENLKQYTTSSGLIGACREITVK